MYPGQGNTSDAAIISAGDGTGSFAAGGTVVLVLSERLIPLDHAILGTNYLAALLRDMDEPRSGREEVGAGFDPDAVGSGLGPDEGGPGTDERGLDSDGVEALSEPIRVTNESAEVVVRKVRTGKGVRLEIESPTKGHRIRLDAIALESLTWQDPSLISEFLEDPHGPDPED